MRARPPCTCACCACACARCTALAAPYLGGSPAVLRARRRVQQIQRNLEDFGPRKMSVQRTGHGPTNRPSERTNRPSYVPSPRTVSIARPRDRSPAHTPARPSARLASNEAVSVTASVRPSVGTHSGFRSSSSSSIQHVPYTNTNAAVKRWPAPRRAGGGGRPGTARRPRPLSARLRPPSPTAATSVIARGPPRWLPPCPRRLSAETPRTP